MPAATAAHLGPPTAAQARAPVAATPKALQPTPAATVAAAIQLLLLPKAASVVATVGAGMTLTMEAVAVTSLGFKW
jgi:hypothetical protein